MNTDTFDRILQNDNAALKSNNFETSVVARDFAKMPRQKCQNAGILLQVMLLIKDRLDQGSKFVNLLAWAYWNWFPDYFFETPASSTGKYHPAFANKQNGLVLHSLAAARYADSLLELLPGLDIDDKNKVIVAAWFHDMFKYGDPQTYRPGFMSC